MRTALIFGVGGQDGSYLAQWLLGKGYKVVGSSRDAQMSNRTNLRQLGIDRDVELLSVAITDFRSVLQALARACPDEIYNLAGQSSVGLSFEQPVETLESISTATLNILEGIRFFDARIRFYNAGSSECFGNTESQPASESSPFRPRSPYAVAKACATNLVANYREAYNLYACTGILFNHESPLRPRRFVTRKIVEGAFNIHLGNRSNLTLGNLDISRDWGWAPDYVQAMWMMLQRETAADFVIATGRTVALRDFVDCAFKHFELDWRDHVIIDDSLLRPADIQYSAADIRRAQTELGWQARHTIEDVVRMMCEAERTQVAV